MLLIDQPKTDLYRNTIALHLILKLILILKKLNFWPDPTTQFYGSKLTDRALKCSTSTGLAVHNKGPFPWCIAVRYYPSLTWIPEAQRPVSVGRSISKPNKVHSFDELPRVICLSIRSRLLKYEILKPGKWILEARPFVMMQKCHRGWQKMHWFEKTFLIQCIFSRTQFFFIMY